MISSLLYRRHGKARLAQQRDETLFADQMRGIYDNIKTAVETVFAGKERSEEAC